MTMDFSTYQEEARRTAAMSPEWEFRTLIFALGVADEAGEVAGAVKKHVGHGHSAATTRAKVREEIGDVLWYLANLSLEYGLRLEECAEANIEKLRARYPEGFSTERSINRIDAEEALASERAPQDGKEDY